MRASQALAALSLLAACGESTVAPATAPATAVVSFAPTPPPMDWGRVPFPSDLYRDDAGAIALGALPTPLSDGALFDAFRALLSGRDGFCATCGVHFAIDGELAPGQVGDDAPGATVDPAGAAIVLADVDPDSPERGRTFPLRRQWDAANHRLSIRPASGIALHRRRRYAAAVTTALRAADGTPVGASPAFLRARDGGRSDDPVVERARQNLAPALAELARIGVARATVVGVAAFTTEDVTADLLGVRAATQSGPAPAARVERVWRGDEIDDLLGRPAEDRPGIDVPPLAGTEGARAIRHGSLAAVVAGRFDAPRVVDGRGAAIGVLRRDPDGRVEAGSREEVPFVLTLPTGADPSRLPVIVAHHGFSASRITGFATAETAARAGVAVLAIDAFQHGDRAVSAVDRANSMRGLPGPDGFAESEPADVSARVFGIIGTPPGLDGFPGYPEGTLLQFVADVVSAVRLAREGDLGRALDEVVPGGPWGTDPARIGYVGNSLGAVVGVGAITAEPSLRAAVQNVQPGSIVEVLAESPEFRPLVDAVFLPRLGVDGPFDEVERRLLLDPVIDLSRWILEPVDPLALAPYVFAEPVVAGPRPEVLFQIAALDEVGPPGPTESLLAAIGAPLVHRWDPAAHGMLEVQDQVSRYEPPVAPPFRRRDVEIPVANPIAAEHEQIREFLARTLGG